MQYFISGLRAFLRFCFAVGLVPASTADTCPPAGGLMARRPPHGATRGTAPDRSAGSIPHWCSHRSSARMAVTIRSIENQVHLVRDVTLREDSSKVRAQSRPRNLATLRNLVTGLIRQVGRNDIAAAIRDAEYDNDLLTALLRLAPAL